MKLLYHDFLCLLFLLLISYMYMYLPSTLLSHHSPPFNLIRFKTERGCAGSFLRVSNRCIHFSHSSQLTITLLSFFPSSFLLSFSLLPTYSLSLPSSLPLFSSYCLPLFSVNFSLPSLFYLSTFLPFVSLPFSLLYTLIETG